MKRIATRLTSLGIFAAIGAAHGQPAPSAPALSFQETQSSPVFIAAEYVPCVLAPPSANSNRVAPDTNASVRATLDAQGHVETVELTQSSGDANFDSAMLERVRAAVCQPVKDLHGVPIPVQTVFRSNAVSRGSISTITLRPAETDKLHRLVLLPQVRQGLAAGWTAVVAVRYAPDGTISSAEIKQSTGDEAWNKSVLSGIRELNLAIRDANGKVHAQVSFHIQPPPPNRLRNSVPSAGDGEQDTVQNLVARRPDLQTHSHMTETPQISVQYRARLQMPGTGPEQGSQYMIGGMPQISVGSRSQLQVPGPGSQ